MRMGTFGFKLTLLPVRRIRVDEEGSNLLPR
jgi:hypothetical protein